MTETPPMSCVTFHTSGSSSSPKTVAKPFSALAAETDMHARRLSAILARRPVFLSTIDPSHMYGILWRTLLPRAARCPAREGRILAPETLAAQMESAESVFILTTPSFLDRFVRYAAQYRIPRNAAAIVSSGAPLSRETAARTQDVFGCAPLEIFGSTETGGVAWRVQDGGSDGLFNVFPPVSVSSGCGRRLVVESPFSHPRIFTMGDMAEISVDGRRFRLLGRGDRIVKIAERQVNLPEMEERIKALPGVEDVALVPVEGRLGRTLGAAIVLSNGTRADAAALSLEWRRRLVPEFPPGAAPKRFRFIGELPYDSRGKLPQSAVRALFGCGEAAP